MLKVYEKEKVICAEGTINKSGKKVFVFLVDGMLVDTGPEVLKQELIGFYHDQSVSLAALTHSCEDHSGMAAWIRDNLDVPIYIHPYGIPICAEPGSYPKYRQNTWGGREAFPANSLGRTIRSRTLEWHVLYTPGHAQDHVSFFNKETGILFSGDLYVSPETKVGIKTESIPQIMDSIRLLLALDFEHLFCSHVGYIANGREMLVKKLKYLVKLTKDVKLLQEEGLAIDKIDEQLFPETYPIVSFSDNKWDSIHMVQSILSNDR